MIDSELVLLVLTPFGNGKVEALVAALKANREWVEAKVVSNRDVLLRGFDVHGRPNKIFFAGFFVTGRVLPYGDHTRRHPQRVQDRGASWMQRLLPR
jgi:hypothetical protein